MLVRVMQTALLSWCRMEEALAPSVALEGITLLLLGVGGENMLEVFRK